MNPTLHDQLKQWKKDKATVEKERKRNEKKKNRYHKQEKRTEKLSTYDVMNLMGMNRQTLKRGKGGAYKQK
ncbi:hypothetical protein P4699_20295 [Priestia aryabhattai]|uniref:hypothetical protein n=1 Tax=Priestia aryabhattai TaxID=412384 RepID=UPI002E24EB06|nr:hypothetical protein [Priestia aryabhattai]